MIIKGGHFLGQGTYGCVFHPSIDCRIKRQQKEIFKKGVSKVFVDESGSSEEFEESKKINNMDKDGRYTNKVLGKCEILASQLTADEKNSCKHTVDIDDSKLKLTQIIYSNKGIDLKIFMKKNRYMYNLTDTFDYILNLLKGIRLIVKYNYVHLDIKPENILITDSDKALLIDFGLGRTFESLYDIDNSEYIWEHEYIWYPPEFKYLKFLTSDEIPDELIRIGFNNYFINKIIDFKSKYDLEYDDTCEYKYKADLLSFLKNIEPDVRKYGTIKQISELFVKNFAHKTDVYSIGKVMDYIQKYSKKNNTNLNIESEFKRICLKAHHLNPYERYTIKELVNDFERLMFIYKNETSNYNSPKPSNSLKPSNSQKQKLNLQTTETEIKTSSSNNRKLNDCMKHNKLELNNMVEEYKLPNHFKRLNKKLLCEKLIPYIQKSKINNLETNYNSSGSSFKQYNEDSTKSTIRKNITIEECMKYTKRELNNMIEEYKLPSNLKNKNKLELCKALTLFKTKK